jgi:hypothetical protein
VAKSLGAAIAQMIFPADVDGVIYTKRFGDIFAQRLDKVT